MTWLSQNGAVDYWLGPTVGIYSIHDLAVLVLCTVHNVAVLVVHTVHDLAVLVLLTDLVIGVLRCGRLA